jgi:hypothetical protein
MFEWLLYATTHDFRDRLRLVRYFFDRRPELERLVIFDGAQGLDMEVSRRRIQQAASSRLAFADFIPPGATTVCNLRL